MIQLSFDSFILNKQEILTTAFLKKETFDNISLGVVHCLLIQRLLEHS